MSDRAPVKVLQLPECLSVTTQTLREPFMNSLIDYFANPESGHLLVNCSSFYVYD